MDPNQLNLFQGATGPTEWPETPKGMNGPAGPSGSYQYVDPPKDDVNNPFHYTAGTIEVFDFISAWNLSFAEGNVVKYLIRAPYKGSRLKDLKKARWYLDQLIAEAEEHGL